MRQPESSGHADVGGGADASTPAVAGQVLGHYQIVSELGRGGMGVVYQARDLKLGRVVALKTPRPDQSSAHDRHRFLREAQAAARLSHPHIAPIFEVFEEGDRLWVAMEFIEGLYAAHERLAGWESSRYRRHSTR